MKKLYNYAVDFLVEKHKDNDRWYGLGQSELELLIEKSEVKEFLDYIWENPNV